MKIGRACSLCVAGVLSWASARGLPPTSQTPFVTVLLRKWPAWDRNQDGRLSPEEIDAAVLDSSVRGDDAAAAGTLKLMARRKSMNGVALTKEYFQKYGRQRMDKGAAPVRESAEWMTAKALDQDDETADRGAASTPDWDLFFSAGQSRINGAAGGWTGRFILDHLRQGPLSDCFFLSSLGSLLTQRPEQLKGLLTPLPDGTFRAGFPDGVRFIVRCPTEAELAISSVSAGDGCWLAVMEQAFGQYRMLKKGRDVRIEATDVISHGGHTGPAIAALTGRGHESITLAASVERRKKQAGKVLPDLRAELESAIREHRLMTVSVVSPAVDGAGRITEGDDRGTAPRIPPGITRRHAYAIISYDRREDVIGLWNPHGQVFTPKGAPGPVNGYPTAHGRFTLPLTEAYGFGSNFTFEISKSTKAKASR